MKIKNLYDLSDVNDFKEEIIEVLKNTHNIENLQIERILSQGHTTPINKWYEQDTEELVFLLKGDATIEFENNELVYLKEGDYLLIPKYKKHKVVKTSIEPACIWLAIHYK